MRQSTGTYKAEKQKIKKTRMVHSIFIVYMVILFRITVFRSSFKWDGLFLHGTVNLIPFVDLCNLMKQGRWETAVYLFFGNLIWFIPLGVFLEYRKITCSLFRIGIYGFCLSLVIEICQFVFGTGVTDVEDLILNTLGTIGGALLLKLVHDIKKKENRKGK